MLHASYVDEHMLLLLVSLPLQHSKFNQLDSATDGQYSAALAYEIQFLGRIMRVMRRRWFGRDGDYLFRYHFSVIFFWLVYHVYQGWYSVK
jgi:hypothetical protein